MLKFCIACLLTQLCRNFGHCWKKSLHYSYRNNTFYSYLSIKMHLKHYLPSPSYLHTYHVSKTSDHRPKEFKNFLSGCIWIEKYNFNWSRPKNGLVMNLNDDKWSRCGDAHIVLFLVVELNFWSFKVANILIRNSFYVISSLRALKAIRNINGAES